jgi:hypothetical protein
MTVRLQGSTSGYTELDANAVAGNNNIKLPGANGSPYQILRNGTNAGETEFVDKLVLGTAQNATGANIDFTSIPSWVKRITVMLVGVSSAGGYFYLRLGTSSGFETTNYISVSGVITNVPAANTLSVTDGFNLTATGTDAAALFSGSAILTLAGSNTWVLQSCLGSAFNGRAFFSSGSKSLAGTLDRVQLLASGGSPFDAGSINIMYE